MKRGQKIAISIAAVAIVLVVPFFAIGPGKDIRNLWKAGAIQAAIDDSGENRKYDASRQSNLKALATALNLYEESEGHYPFAPGWMDAISGRLRDSDMSEEEGKKKLIRPNLINPQPGQYGYALNDAASGKYKDDVKDKKAPLVYESSDLSKNAHGNPSSQKIGFGVTMGGDVIKL